VLRDLASRQRMAPFAFDAVGACVADLLVDTQRQRSRPADNRLSLRRDHPSLDSSGA
jgi:hypothetical protein